MSNTYESNHLDMIKQSLDLYLKKSEANNFLAFTNHFEQWFSKDFFDKVDISDEEKTIIISVITNKAFLIFDRKGLQHPTSYPFIRIIDTDSKPQISFSGLFSSALERLDDKKLDIMTDMIIGLSSKFQFTGYNLSKIQYYIHKYLFWHKNIGYEFFFSRDYDSLIVTDQFLNLYDEMLEKFPDAKNEPNFKKIDLYKQALKAKYEFGNIVHGFDIGRIKAAYLMEKIYGLNARVNKNYHLYGLHKTLSSILKPHVLEFSYEKGKKESFVTHIKEFADVNIEKLMETKNYNKLSILLPYLPATFKDILLNYVADHSDLKMIRTFLEGGAYYLTVFGNSDEVINAPQRDIQKTKTMLALLVSQSS
jgi:hypothetical protein